jgi:hypothetical protein
LVNLTSRTTFYRVALVHVMNVASARLAYARRLSLASLMDEGRRHDPIFLPFPISFLNSNAYSSLRSGRFCPRSASPFLVPRPPFVLQIPLPRPLLPLPLFLLLRPSRLRQHRLRLRLRTRSRGLGTVGEGEELQGGLLQGQPDPPAVVMPSSVVNLLGRRGFAPIPRREAMR